MRNRSPQPSAPLLPYDDLDGKLTERASVALPPDLKAALQDEADKSGQALGALLRDFARQRCAMQRATGNLRNPADPTLRLIDTLRVEYVHAMADQKLRAGERARLTKILSDMLGVWYGERRSA